ncbi:MAG: hypothetical protein SOX32_09165 [Candidatus Choladocola sp.]|nr:hypothetical protein [Candidatus Choladocola sp.]
MNMKQREQRILFVILGAVLFGVYIFNLEKLRYPSIMLDEIGYWSSAAYWDNKDWSGVMGTFSSYYSYGYSVILYILMKVAKSPQSLHQLAILVNVVMILISFFIANKVAERIFPNVKYYIRLSICFLAFFYPSTQYNIHVAWSETYLMFLFWISVWCIINIYQKARIFDIILYSLLLINMYITHQRSLGVLLTGLFLFCILAFVKKLRFIKIIVFILLILTTMYIARVVKSDVQNNVFQNKTIAEEQREEITISADANDYGGQIGKIKYIFTLEGFFNLMISFLGKLYYFGLASFFLGFEGIYCILHTFYLNIKNKEKLGIRSIIMLYILLSYLATVMISAVFMIYPSRLDTVAYGRYTDWIGIVLIIIGGCQLYISESKDRLKRYLFYSAITVCFTIVFLMYIAKYEVSGFFASCSPVMMFFKKAFGDNIILTMTAGCILISVVIVLLMDIFREKMKTFIVTCLIIGSWCIMTEPGINELIDIQNKDRVDPVINYIKNNTEENVYFVYNSDTPFNIYVYTGSIQYFLEDRTVNCIESTNVTFDDNSIYIMAQNCSIPEGYVVKCKTDYYWVIQKGGI